MALEEIYMYAFQFVEVLLSFLTMADFPPNLEDGEQWLPSDIYHEIVYGSIDPKALVDNTSEEGAMEVWNEPIKSSFEFSSEGEAVDHEGCPRAPAHRYGEEVKGFAGNSGGTGVFLPQTPLKESPETKGTGVFLQSFSSTGPVTIRKAKKGGKMFVVKKETPEKKEASQVLAEVCLPKEWTY